MTENPTQPEESGRIKGFLAAVNECCQHPERIVALHPLGSTHLAPLRAASSKSVLFSLLFQEAARLSGRPTGAATQGDRRRPDTARALAYYQARRGASHMPALAAGVDQLPRFWLRLLNLAPREIRGVARDVGKRVIAGSLAALGETERVRATEPLPTDAALTILRWPSEPLSACADLIAPMLASCGGSSADAVAEEVGLMLLAAARACLGAGEQKAFAALARVNIDSVLRAHAGPAIQPSHLSFLADLIAEAVADSARSSLSGAPRL